MKSFMLSLILFCTATVVVHAQSDSISLAAADSLFEHYQWQEALDAYNQILAGDTDNFDALWRSSLLYARIGNGFEEEVKQRNYFKKAEKRAWHALQVDSTNSQSNYVMAVAMGRMALIGGAKERVAASRAIKKYGELALKYDSTNAGAWHLLGRWNYEVSNLNFAERLAANVLFGGLPDGASTDTAAQYIERAIELKDDYLLYYYDLARVYDELDKDQQAITVCQKVLEMPDKSPDDPEIKADCQNIINDLQ